MFQNTLTVIVVLLISGVEIASCSECCQTGSSTYQLCSSYCCKDNSLFSVSPYHECCYSYSRQVSNNYASSSDCGTWFADNVWAPILIGLGSLGAVVVGIVVCCVCCIKGCAGNNTRTGAIIYPGQQQGQGVLMVSNTASQQGMMMQQQQQQPYPYGAPMQPVQAAYPPVPAGPSYSGPSDPPPYTNPGSGKHSGGPPN